MKYLAGFALPFVILLFLMYFMRGQKPVTYDELQTAVRSTAYKYALITGVLAGFAASFLLDLRLLVSMSSIPSGKVSSSAFPEAGKDGHSSYASSASPISSSELQRFCRKGFRKESSPVTTPISSRGHCFSSSLPQQFFPAEK